MKGRIFLIAIAFLLLFFNSIAFSAPDVPPKPIQFRYVYDYAGLMSQNDIEEIERVGKALDDATKAQIIVVTVDTIGDYPIEEYSLALFRNWGIGDKEKNNGVLFLVVKDRLLKGQAGKVRIGVGYGLEGAIPDSVAGRILDDFVLTSWAKGEYSKGIYAGYMAVASRVAKEYNIDLQGLDVSEYSVNTSSNDSSISWEDIAAVIILILIFIIFGRGGRNIRRNWWGPGSFGSGGFGDFRGGSFGGGGFGGGSAGGGGASR